MWSSRRVRKTKNTDILLKTKTTETALQSGTSAVETCLQMEVENLSHLSVNRPLANGAVLKYLKDLYTCMNNYFVMPSQEWQAYLLMVVFKIINSVA